MKVILDGPFIRHIQRNRTKFVFRSLGGRNVYHWHSVLRIFGAENRVCINEIGQNQRRYCKEAEKIVGAKHWKFSKYKY